MRLYFLLFLFAFCLTLSSQDRNTGNDINYQEREEIDTGYLKKDNMEVYYQRVFDGDPGSLIKKLFDKGAQLIDDGSNSKSYKMEKYSIDNRKHGVNGFSVSGYMLGEFSFVLRIEEKKDRYRVTISNIQTLDNITLDFGTVEGGPTTTNIEEYFLKRNGDYKYSQRKSIALLNKDFNSLVTISDMNNDNW